MPHANPPSRRPPLQTDESGAATTAAAYRAWVPNVQPDDVLRNVRRCNGFRSWSLAPREVYQLADCTLTIYDHHEREPELNIEGPDAEQVRSILVRLGFENDVVISQIPPVEDSR